jgi:hypothetical protein
MWKLLFIPVFVVVTLNNAFATCDEYRLDKNGGVMQFIPVLDQQDVGTCYAQAAAQVLTAKLRVSDPRKYAGVIVSPLSLGLGYREYLDQGPNILQQSASRRINVVDGENTFFPLSASGEFPICDYKDVEAKLTSTNYSFLFAKTTNLAELIFSPNKHDAVIAQMIADMCANANPHHHNIADIKAVIDEAVKQDKPVKLVRHMIEGNCKSINVPEGLIKVTGTHPVKSGSAADEIAFIDKLFDAKHPLPVSIDYCSGVFTFGPTLEGRRILHEQTLGLPGSDLCGPHASIVIGRREVKSSNGTLTCEYLIRNSWGPTCEGYRSEYNGKCENGQVWVTKEALQRNILKANSLE